MRERTAVRRFQVLAFVEYVSLLDHRQSQFHQKEREKRGGREGQKAHDVPSTSPKKSVGEMQKRKKPEKY